MKPNFLITAISEKKCYCTSYHQDRGGIEPASLHFALEIEIQCLGSFSEYLQNDGLNKQQILGDLLEGKISIVGTDNYNKLKLLDKLNPEQMEQVVKFIQSTPTTTTKPIKSQPITNILHVEK